jgi:hypothetical protein
MALAVGAWGQTQPVTQTVAATAVCVSIRAQNNSTVGIIVSGTWSGTFTPNVQISTVSGAPTVAKKVVPVDSTTAQATVTANGGYRADVSGFALFNFCSTGTWTSGTATVTLNVTPQAAASTVAGGGGGTVTSVGGTAPIASSGGATPAISLQNSAAANVTAAYGTDTGFLSCAGAVVSGDVVTGDANTGCHDSGTLLSSLAGTGGTSMPWAPFPTGASTAGFSGTANRALVWGVWVPTYMTFSKINYKVAAADTSGGTYDLGLGNSSGTIVCHTGNIAASNFTSVGPVQLSLAASCTVPPGRYYVAITCSATSLCATLTATSGNAISFNPTSAGDAVTIAAGGTLSSFTPPAATSVTWTATAPIFGFQ